MHILRPSPRPGTPLPVVVWVYGGAFRMGSKDSGIERLVPLVARGYVGACIEYRLSHEATFPAQIQDCKCAIRYLRAHAADLGIDLGPDRRLGRLGRRLPRHDARRHEGVPELEGDGGWGDAASRVQAVCDFFGPTDFLQMDGRAARWSTMPRTPRSRS